MLLYFQDIDNIENINVSSDDFLQDEFKNVARNKRSPQANFPNIGGQNGGGLGGGDLGGGGLGGGGLGGGGLGGGGLGGGGGHLKDKIKQIGSKIKEIGSSVREKIKEKIG